MSLVVKNLAPGVEVTTPTRYARGWHCVGLAKDFRDGKPHPLDIFGGTLVVFQAENGQLHILDGFCPHMGASLGGGKVVGNTLACPFHDWRWGGDGRCKQIPYAKHIPIKARVKSWPVMEQCGMLFVYHDPEENPPPPEVAIPPIQAMLNGETTDWNWETLPMPGVERELVDNLADAPHFYAVHKTRSVHFENIFEKHVAVQITRQRARDDLSGNEPGAFSADTTLEIKTTRYGPAYLISEYIVDYKGVAFETYLVLAHYPVTPNTWNLHIGVCAKKVSGFDNDKMTAVIDQFSRENRASLLQDVEIWQTKTPIDHPVLCEGDGPVYQLRRWYDQFFCNVNEIESDMVRRFERVTNTDSQFNWGKM